jgi:hypothetical protein
MLPGIFGSTLLLGTLTVAAAILGLGSLLYLKQESLLYMPEIEDVVGRDNRRNPPGYRSPSEYLQDGNGNSGIFFEYETHYIPSRTNTGENNEEVLLHSWLLLQPPPKQRGTAENRASTAPTIIFFHGNAG